MDLTTVTGTKSGTSFWKTKPGKFGIVVLCLLGLGSLSIMDKILALIYKIAQDAVLTVISLAALAAIVYVLLDPKFRNLIWFIYKSIMRSIVGAFIVIDPIGILKNYVSNMKQKLSEMAEQIAKLRGALRTLQNKIADNQSKIQNSLSLAAQAKKNSKPLDEKLNERDAARLEKTNTNLTAMGMKMEAVYRNLKRLYEVSDFVIKDTENEVNNKEDERKMALAGYSAMSSAAKILQGDKDKKEIFDMTMQAVVDDIGMKVGEMEDFMEMSQGIITHMDLENGVLDDKGAQMLDKWEKTDSILLGDEKHELISYANDPSNKLDLDKDPVLLKPAAPKAKSKYFENV